MNSAAAGEEGARPMAASAVQNHTPPSNDNSAACILETPQGSDGEVRPVPSSPDASASKLTSTPTRHMPKRKAADHLSPGRVHVPHVELQVSRGEMKGVMMEHTQNGDTEQDTKEARRGDLQEPPTALRSHLDLRNDASKTGMSIPADLPECFPRGPWLVDFSKSSEDISGWKNVEGTMQSELQNWASDPSTPRQEKGQWRQGGFKLRGVTRSRAVGKQGTRKVMQCTGREIYAKGGASGCGFKITLEFVNTVHERPSPGWVLKKVEGEEHHLVSSGEPHTMTVNVLEAQADAVLGGGNAQLSLDPYHSLGFTLKNSGMGVSTIDKALRQKASEIGGQPRWTKKQVAWHFGLTVVEELVDFKDVLLNIHRKTHGDPTMHHALHYQVSRLARIFSTTESFAHVLLQYVDPSDLVVTFDTTFGTNKYGMSLGFFVSPDKNGHTQVIAMLLIQHEDQDSLTWGFREFRIALNGGKDGSVVPRVVLTDGDGKIFTAIRDELVMMLQGGQLVMRTIFSLHLLCLFHLWLNIKDSVRPVYRVGKGWAPEWLNFEHLFWKTSYQTDEAEADMCLNEMERVLEEWITKRSFTNPDISARRDGRKGEASKQSLSDDARALVRRLKSVKEKWIRAWSWRTFTFGAVASQRGENAFRWYKEQQTSHNKLLLSECVKRAYCMAQERMEKSAVTSVKDRKLVDQRAQASTKKMGIHRMFAGVMNGEIAEFALQRVSTRDAITLATSFAVNAVSKREEDTEGGGKVVHYEFHVWSPKKIVVAPFSNSQACSSGSRSVKAPTQHDDSLPNACEDPDDYCAPTDLKHGVIRRVSVSFCHTSKTWKASCTCLEDISKGMPCRHIMAAVMKVSEPEASFSVSISMFHPLFRATSESQRGRVDRDHEVNSQASKSQQPSADRLLWCSHVNYSKSFALARQMCAAAQDSAEETQELMKVLSAFGRSMQRRQKQKAEDNDEMEPRGISVHTTEHEGSSSKTKDAQRLLSFERGRVEESHQNCDQGMSQEKDVNSEDATSATVSTSLESLKQRSVMGPAKDPSKTRVEKRMTSRGEDTQRRGKKPKGASAAKRKEMSMRSPSPPPPSEAGDVDMPIETTKTGERGRDRPERVKVPARHKYGV